MDHDDWIRFDLLYRYEQVLSAMEDPHGAVLYCNEFKINERGDILPLSRLRKPDQPPFPYLFINTICHCLLVPKALWEKVDGLRSETDGAQDFDLCLRLDLAGAQFQNVPVFLYGWRVHPGSTALSASIKDYATPAGVRALTDYARARGLDWRIEPGLSPTSYRAVPAHPVSTPRVHVVIPFKDQKEMTLRCVRAALAQQDVEVCITAIDNQSLDPSTAAALSALGVETLQANYPFNYSRLNNEAVRTSARGKDFPLVLFLNNDVILDPGAIAELAFWAGQSGIGAVGARLRYPSGLLQHGGIEISDVDSGERIAWAHTDHGQALEALAFAKIPRVVEAVTAACALMSKSAFALVGGFDEDLYPVAYSDTDLCRRLRRTGFYSFYTPFATGEHHESLSRGVNPYEDLESSRWLHVHARDRGQKKYVKFLSNHRLEH